MGGQTAVSIIDEPERSEPPEEAIRRRSQEIWEHEGRPEGHAEEHWARARAELTVQMARLAQAQFVILQEANLALSAPEPAQPDANDIVNLLSQPRESVDTGSALAWLAEVNPVKHTAPSIIHGGLLLRGDLESPGDLHFDGRLEGNLRAASLDVGKDAAIAGEVVAGELTVRGSVRGRISGGTVVLCAGSTVEGEVQYRTLTIETGAKLDARFRRLAAE